MALVIPVGNDCPLWGSLSMLRSPRASSPGRNCSPDSRSPRDTASFQQSPSAKGKERKVLRRSHDGMMPSQRAAAAKREMSCARSEFSCSMSQISEPMSPLRRTPKPFSKEKTMMASPPCSDAGSVARSTKQKQSPQCVSLRSRSSKLSPTTPAFPPTLNRRSLAALGEEPRNSYARRMTPTASMMTSVPEATGCHPQQKAEVPTRGRCLGTRSQTQSLEACPASRRSASLMAARAQHKERVGALERTDQFNQEVLGKLDELRDGLVFRMTSGSTSLSTYSGSASRVSLATLSSA